MVAKQCQNILTVKMFILPSHALYEVKFPFHTKFLIRVWNMPTFDQFDSFSNFYSGHDESLSPFSFNRSTENNPTMYLNYQVV